MKSDKPPYTSGNLCDNFIAKKQGSQPGSPRVAPVVAEFETLPQRAGLLHLYYFPSPLGPPVAEEQVPWRNVRMLSCESPHSSITCHGSPLLHRRVPRHSQSSPMLSLQPHAPVIAPTPLSFPQTLRLLPAPRPFFTLLPELPCPSLLQFKSQLSLSIVLT